VGETSEAGDRGTGVTGECHDRELWNESVDPVGDAASSRIGVDLMADLDGGEVTSVSLGIRARLPLNPRSFLRLPPMTPLPSKTSSSSVPEVESLLGSPSLVLLASICGASTTGACSSSYGAGAAGVAVAILCS